MKSDVIAIAEFHLPALFSHRQLTTNAFAARTLLCPTPASVKLGILSALVRQRGPADAPGILSWLSPLTVAWRPPSTIAVSAATVRVWKGSEGAAAGKEPLTMMAGFRELAHWRDGIGLAIAGCPEDHREDLASGLELLPSLGTADSFVQIVAPVQWVMELPPPFVVLDVGSAPTVKTDGVPVLLDDLGPTPQWERINVYRPAGADLLPRLGEDRIRGIVNLPLQLRSRATDGYIAVRQ